MKKRILTIGACVALGIVMLCTTAFVSANSNSGYDDLKAAIKNASTAENFTGNIKMSLKDNGSTLIDVVSDVKAERDRQTAGSASGNVNVKAEGQDKTVSFYKQDGKVVIKVNGSDVYNVIEVPEENKYSGRMENMAEYDRASMEIGEKLMDFMVGDLKNYIVSENKADGAKQISMELSRDEIPAVANLMASMAANNREDKNISDGSGKDPLGLGICKKPNLPELVSDVRIDKAGFKLLVDKNNVINNLALNATLAGKDVNGKVHEITLSFDLTVSDINATTPDTVDLTGKQVRNVDPKELECDE